MDVTLFTLGTFALVIGGSSWLGLSQSFGVYPALSMRAADTPPVRRWRMLLNTLAEKLKRRSKEDFKGHCHNQVYSSVAGNSLGRHAVVEHDPLDPCRPAPDHTGPGLG